MRKMRTSRMFVSSCEIRFTTLRSAMRLDKTVLNVTVYWLCSNLWSVLYSGGLRHHAMRCNAAVVSKRRTNYSNTKKLCSNWRCGEGTFQRRVEGKKVICLLAPTNLLEHKVLLVSSRELTWSKTKASGNISHVPCVIVPSNRYYFITRDGSRQLKPEN